jgi:hypothetical protein
VFQRNLLPSSSFNLEDGCDTFCEMLVSAYKTQTVECFCNMALLVLQGQIYIVCYNRESYICSDFSSGCLYVALKWDHKFNSERIIVMKSEQCM